jgi:glycogen synthase
MMVERLAFISYETPYAPCGGIAAVMGRMPGYVQAAAGVETIVITPYHHRIEKTRSLKLDWIGGLAVIGAAGELPVDTGRLVDKNGLAWYFLKAQDETFFAGERHPYDVAKTQQEIGAILQRDALFFGAALAKVLPVIDAAAHWNLLMQDWEGATVALALGPAARRRQYGLFLTLHNSYDSGGVSEDRLKAVGIDPRYCKGPAGSTQASVLERVLKLTRTPVFTVSKQFAVDLIQDSVQCKIVAPHLQEPLKKRLCGIDNGPFANLAVRGELLDQAAAGEYTPLKEWKEARKAEALAALKAVQPTPDKPVWGIVEQFGGGDPPWFVMAGRDDPRQKGYDVAALAIRRFLSAGGKACFLFFPIPGDEGQAGLAFLKKLAEQFPGSILVLPFVFKEGFTAALQGAAFGLMPSLYEPFGMANEYYLNGTPVIGRATGGIVQQIVPLRTAKVFTPSVAARADFWYGATARPSGLLFREEDGLPTLEEDWRSINAAGYDLQGGSPDRLEERGRYALIQSMAGQLQAALEDGIRVYQDGGLYFRMLADGVRFIQASFSWERSAKELVDRLSID